MWSWCGQANTTEENMQIYLDLMSGLEADYPDVTFILSAVDQVKKYLHKGMLVILESTTYPGTTEELILPQLESTGLKVGRDFYLGFSPERIDPGNESYVSYELQPIVGSTPGEELVEPSAEDLLLIDMDNELESVRRDIILGGSGNDRLSGGSGEEWIFGGPGDDVLNGGADRQASDLIWGGSGNGSAAQFKSNTQHDARITDLEAR